MGRIIHLAGDPHRQTQSLLPWYINGTLDENEVAMVRAHLTECAECQADLASERTIGDDIATMPIDVEKDWAAMRARLTDRASGSKPVIPFVRQPRPFLRRRIPMGWALTAQAAAAILILGVGRLVTPAAGPAFHTLGSAEPVAPGNLLVIFRPDTTERDMRATLQGSGARLAGGPTASDAYVLRVADAGRDAALVRLRSDAHVVLAEPIDGDAQP